MLAAMGKPHIKWTGKAWRITRHHPPTGMVFDHEAKTIRGIQQAISIGALPAMSPDAFVTRRSNESRASFFDRLFQSFGA